MPTVFPHRGESPVECGSDSVVLQEYLFYSFINTHAFKKKIGDKSEFLKIVVLKKFQKKIWEY